MSYGANDTEIALQAQSHTGRRALWQHITRLKRRLSNLASWSHDLPDGQSQAIAKVEHLELARLVIEAGKQMHRDGYCHVDGPVVFHCLEGEIELKTPDRARRVRAGQLVYLLGGTDHTIAGIADSVVLLTIVLKTGESQENHRR